MTRSEYMEKLAQGLKGYDEDFAMDILEDYRRHFDEAAADGRSEEAVCDELGSVEDFLRDIPEEFRKDSEGEKAEQTGQTEQDKNSNSSGYSADFDKFASEAGKMASAAGKIAVNVAGSVGNALNKLGDMIDKAVNDAKNNYDDDDEWEEPEDNTEGYSGDPLVFGEFPGISRLNMSLVYADIEVVNQLPSDEVLITLSRPLTKKEKMYLKTTVCEEEGTLKITQESREKIRFGFSNYEPITYYVTLPTHCDKLTLSTVSGDIRTEALVNAGKCKFNTVSGSVKVNEPLKADKVIIESVSGSVKVNECVDAGELKLGSVSGSVKGTVCAGQLDVNTVSGSQNIAFAGPSAGKLDTVSGSIKIKLLADTGLDIKSSSMSGSLKLFTSQKIVWDNDEGNTVFFGFQNKGSRRAVFGNGGVKLKTGSVSGPVKVYDFNEEDE